MFFDRGNHYEFLSLGQELAAPGELQHPQTFPFNFKNVEKQYESYNGINVKLRYFTRVTVSRRMADVIREKDIWVYSYRIPPEINSSIKMDVGIEDCLHIEFEYSKSKYHLKDVIVGRIYFLLVRLKIKHMELSIIRRETTGVAPNQYNESETLVRFEIMDGSPSRGETIPIRLFLGGFDLTPTFREVNKKYSVRYYLSLVLIDEGTSNPASHPQELLRHRPTLTAACHVLSAADGSLPASLNMRKLPWCASNTFPDSRSELQIPFITPLLLRPRLPIKSDACHPHIPLILH